MSTCEFNMELVFRFEDLDVERTVWSEVLHSPGSQNGLMILSIHQCIRISTHLLIFYQRIIYKKNECIINVEYILTFKCLSIHMKSLDPK